MRYELTDTAEQVSFEAPSYAAAAAATLAVGQGAYGARAATAGATPQALIPKVIEEGAARWVARTFGLSLDALLEQQREHLARTLRSFSTGTGEALRRRALILANTPDSARRTRLLEREAMRNAQAGNAITRRAHQLAESIERARTRADHA